MQPEKLLKVIFYFPIINNFYAYLLSLNYLSSVIWHLKIDCILVVNKICFDNDNI